MIYAGYILDIVIIGNEITISEIPEVQHFALLIEHDEFFEKLKT